MAALDLTLPDLTKTSADPLAPKDAIEYFRSKVPVTGNEWADLISQNHDWAFKLAGVADIDVIEQVYSALETAIADGTGFDEFKEAIGEQLENAWGGTVSEPGWRIETIFRTNIQSSYQKGHRQQAKEQKDDRPYGMLDVVEDDATSDICADLDDQIGGQAISLDDPIWNTAWPPNHFCLLPGSVIQGTFISASKVDYSGEVIEFETAKGNILTCTPNHPILTDKGFIPAGRLSEGLYVISYKGDIPSSRPSSSGVVNDEYNNPTIIEKIFNLFNETGEFFSCRVTPLDFHGDAVGVKGNIDIVGSYAKLLSDLNPSTSDFRSEFVFPLPFTDALGLSGDTADFMRYLRSFGHASRIDASAYEHISNNVSGNSISFGESEDRLPGVIRRNNFVDGKFDSSGMTLVHNLKNYDNEVGLDIIVKTRKHQYSGPVYDLESPYGWIIANNVFTSNSCRSSVITMTEEEAIAQGLLDEPPEVEVDDDFGEDGSDGEPDPEDYPEDLQESLGRFL